MIFTTNNLKQAWLKHQSLQKNCIEMINNIFRSKFTLK